MAQQKRHRKDRRDGHYIPDMDSMHIIMAHLLPRRTACEAFIHVKVDLTNILEYLERKNSGGSTHKYTVFHVIAAAIAKMIVLRPYMNRFISGRRFYQRDDVRLAFVVKREFDDQGKEGLLCLSYEDDDTIDTLSAKIVAGAKAERSGHSHSAMNTVDFLARLPRWLLAIIIGILKKIDFFGRVPADLADGDPDFSTVFISNLGSIQLDATYHHLNDWGTNSIFMAIGEKHMARFMNEQGEAELRPAINLGLTLDERIADGYYYSRSMKLFKYLLQNPQLLELPAKEEVTYGS